MYVSVYYVLPHIATTLVIHKQLWKNYTLKATYALEKDCIQLIEEQTGNGNTEKKQNKKKTVADDSKSF